MTSRAQRREVTQRAILDASLKLLAEGGQEALTVRGLARQLNLVPSALYRYVTSRQDLLTILFQNLHNDWADALQAALDEVPDGDVRSRWRAFARALRQWSLDHPHEWTLINGAPPRDYHAVEGQNLTAGMRLYQMLGRLGADAEAAGLQPRVTEAEYPGDLSGITAFITESGIELQPETVVAGLAAWHLLMGALYAERFGAWGHDLIAPEDYYDLMVLASEKLLFGSAA